MLEFCFGSSTPDEKFHPLSPVKDKTGKPIPLSPALFDGMFGGRTKRK